MIIQLTKGGDIMAEGGHTPDLPTPGQIATADEATRRAESRIPANTLREMNVNSYIASLTDMANSPLNQPEQEKSLNKAVGLYSYLRDKQQAQTVGGARDSIAQRKIAPEVVKLWVDEEMAVNPGEYDAIIQGYPEYAEDLKRVRKEVVDRILGKGK